MSSQCQFAVHVSTAINSQNESQDAILASNIMITFTTPTIAARPRSFAKQRPPVGCAEKEQEITIPGKPIMSCQVIHAHRSAPLTAPATFAAPTRVGVGWHRISLAWNTASDICGGWRSEPRNIHIFPGLR